MIMKMKKFFLSEKIKVRVMQSCGIEDDIGCNLPAGQSHYGVAHGSLGISSKILSNLNDINNDVLRTLK